MEAKLNSNLFPIISVAMYGTRLAPENMFHNSQIDDDKEEGYIHFDSEYFWDKFDNSKYELAIENLADQFLSGTLEAQGIEIGIKTGSIYSPRYYNHSNDNIDLEVTYVKGQLLKFADDNAEAFDDFLHENFTSYDGFYSHTPNNYRDWLVDFKNDVVQSIGAILTFVFLDEIEDYHNDFINLCYESLFYSEFIDYTQYDEEVQKVQKYAQASYGAEEPSSIDDLDLEILDEEAVEKIITEVHKSIEEQTLKLF
jgi:hypothetical protein